MKAINTEFTKFLGAEAQYCVPIYQRKYSWDKDDCIKLLEDIIKVSLDQNRPCHFIGSIIYLAKDDSQHASAAKEYLVIDGQQRLTTLSILLIALADYTKLITTDETEYSKSVTNFDKLARRYLINEDEVDDMHYKIRLNEEDFYAYKKLLEFRKKPDDIKSSKIFSNYSFLFNHMKRREISPQVIFNGIKKLMLVDICLVPEDNAQLVFETVNSTGKPLSTADKIRNFLLMTVNSSEQTKLYNDYWHPMEIDFGMQHGYSGKFVEFFYYYMTSVMKQQLPSDNYYEQFKNYYFDYPITDKSKKTENIVREIRQYSKNYKRWCEASCTGNKIDRELHKIRNTGQFKITPAILKILYDMNEGALAEDDANSILTIIESYLMRRTICVLPTNSAGPVCISILKSMYENDKLKALKNTLKNLTWAQRIPTDKEIVDTLQTLEIYSINKTKTKMILDRLENHNRKEYIATKDYTIEHIMPQTLSNEWKADLGKNYEKIHEKYLHTLGNLTLTGYNSEYRNKPFKEKQNCKDKNGNQIGYKHTPIHISGYLATTAVWGEEQIIERSKILANTLTQIWKYPL